MTNFITVTEVNSFLGKVNKKKRTIDADNIKDIEEIKNEKYKSRITMKGGLSYYLVGETQKKILGMIKNEAPSKVKKQVKAVKTSKKKK